MVNEEPIELGTPESIVAGVAVKGQAFSAKCPNVS